MGSKDKREQALRRNPKEVRGDDLRAVLEANGFACRPTSDGWTCRHTLLDQPVTLPLTHGSRQAAGLVRPAYVRRALAALDDARARGEEPA